jgi:hypothetical protein
VAEEVIPEKYFFTDKYVLISAGIFILWYVLAALKIINFEFLIFNTPKTGFPVLFVYILLITPYIVGTSIIRYLVINKRFYVALLWIFPIFFILLFINLIFQRMVYDALSYIQDAWAGLDILISNLTPTVLMMIFTFIYAVVLYLKRKKKT